MTHFEAILAKDKESMSEFLADNDFCPYFDGRECDEQCLECLDDWLAREENP